MKMIKSCKRVLCLALCIMFAVSVLPAIGFAADEELKENAAAETAKETKQKFNYLALGASNTNGFGLSGYISSDMYTDEYYANPTANRLKGNVSSGFLKETPAAYPVQIKNSLSEYYDVNLKQYAQCGMRVEEVRLLLDKSYEGDEYTDWRFLNTEGEAEGWFADEYKLLDPPTLDSLQNMYIDAVKEADLITVDLGTNNFGPYLFNRVFHKSFGADFSNIYDENLVAAATGVRDGLKNAVSKALGSDAPKEILDEVDFYLDSIAYAYLGFCENFDEVIRLIKEYNPNADILVLGVQNVLKDTYISYKGITVSAEMLYDVILNAANSYLSLLSPYRLSYRYVRLGGFDGIENLYDVIKKYDGGEIPQVFEDCLNFYDNNLFLKTKIKYTQKLGEDVYQSCLKTYAKMFSRAAQSNVIDVEILITEDYAFSDFMKLEDKIIADAKAGLLSSDEAIDSYLDSLFANEDFYHYLVYFVKFDTGNTLFVHPSEGGHSEMARQIWNAYQPALLRRRIVKALGF